MGLSKKTDSSDGCKRFATIQRCIDASEKGERSSKRNCRISLWITGLDCGKFWILHGTDAHR